MAEIHRRKLLKQLAAGSVAAISLPSLISTCSSSTNPKKEMLLKGNINHSVCRWTYNVLSVEELCETVKKFGFAAIDLVGPKDWPILKKHGVD